MTDKLEDYFTLFALPQSIELDLPALERSYQQLARANHPDRFVNAAAADKLQAVNSSSMINHAYLVLKDFTKRLQHYLQLQGCQVADYQRQVPREFLQQLIDWREQAEEFIKTADSHRLSALLAQINQQKQALSAKLKTLLAVEQLKAQPQEAKLPEGQPQGVQQQEAKMQDAQRLEAPPQGAKLLEKQQAEQLVAAAVIANQLIYLDKTSIDLEDQLFTLND